ncbi:MAG: protein-glutamate O-methyltransferase CheR [Planctomycetales bacterium]|nr:protein-glutamate O-methyltransferase CheR [Planctomycetales bacterium]
MTNLNSEDIDAICRLVDDLCGIYWDESKAYLIEARLGSLLEKSSCKNYRDLASKVRAECVPGLRSEVIDAVTTNETLWFRDSSPFQALKYKIVPELIDAKQSTCFPKRFRIWCAACSTGQEPYSIAMTLADTIPHIESWDVQILGTDISPAAVERASRGIYNKMEIGRGMDPESLKRYFVDRGDGWQVHDRIRSMCMFKPLNLHEPFHMLGSFDIVFCRNVAIYFTLPDQKKLFAKIGEVLAPGGWVFVGSSESLSHLGPQWQTEQHCRSNCYRFNKHILVGT